MIESEFPELSGPGFCDEPHRLLPTLISFGTGIFIAITGVTWKKGECRPLLPRHPYELILQILTPLMTIIGAFLFFAEDLVAITPLISCRSSLPLEFSLYAIIKWVTFFIHIYFVIRAFIIWAMQRHAEAFITVIHISLWVQDLYALVMHQHLLTFQFLILCSFYCWEIEWMLLKLVFWEKKKESFKLLSVIWETFLILYIVAGFLRAAEEWKTIEGEHPDLFGLPVFQRATWIYFYWIIITLSTIGYGDYIPSTVFGRIMIICCILFCISWYSDQLEKLENVFGWYRNVLTNEDSDDNTRHHLVIGCEEKEHLKIFLKYFNGRDMQNLLVLVTKDREDLYKLAKEYGIKVLQEHDPLDVVNKSYIFKGNNEDSIWLVYFPDFNDVPKTTDHDIVSLVKRIKESRCEARLLVMVSDDRKRMEINCLNGWRGSDGTDICIGSQLVQAHMLFHSLQNRLRASLPAIAFANKLVVEKPSKSGMHLNMKFFDAAVEEYFENGNILLGTLTDDREALLPQNMTESCQKILITCLEKRKKLIIPKQAFPIRTSISTSGRPVVEGKNSFLEMVLEMHTFLESNEQMRESRIFSMEGLSLRQEAYEFLQRKLKFDNVTFTYSLEHKYRYCLEEECVCGIYDSSHQCIALLALAEQDPALYNICVELIEGDHLISEEIKDNCRYGDLFYTFAKNHKKILLGTEVVQVMSDRIVAPILNPPPEYQLIKGDIVVSMHS